MAKKFLKLVSVIGLVLLICYSISFLSRALYPSNNITINWASFYNQDKNTVDVLIMGNSHAYSTFNIDIINESSEDDYFLLATNSQNVTQTYYNLKEALKYQKPRMVILETSAIDFNDNYRNGTGSEYDRDWKKESNIDGMRLGLPKIEAIVNQYEPENWGYAFFRILRSHQNWKDTNQFVVNYNFFSNGIKSYTPFAPSTSSMSEDTKNQYMNAQYDGAEYVISEVNLEHFYKLADLCNKENIELVMISAPYYDVYINSINYKSRDDKFSELSSKAGCRYLDINQYYNDIGLEAEDFEDLYTNYHHLNANGADKVTAFCIKWLTEEGLL